LSTIDEDLQILDTKFKQLKLDYDQYFLGSRPREPAMLRAEVQKMIVMFSNTPIQNTASRFRFNSINSRYQAFKRQWDVTVRQIDAGTYARHVFKANLKDRMNANTTDRAERAKTGAAAGAEERLFESYLVAAKSCGQNVASLTPEKLQKAVAKQEAEMRKKLGCDQVKFKVIVQNGKVKLKASAA
jgi:hypothetical protein